MITTRAILHGLYKPAERHPLEDVTSAVQCDQLTLCNSKRRVVHGVDTRHISDSDISDG